MPKEIEEVLEKILNNGFEAFIVGGFVRDYLLNKKTNDIDIATNALPKDLVTIFGPSRKNDIYGSYHLSISSYNIDITTYRKEEYKDNELYITYSDNLINDSLRRDFTINTLCIDVDGNMIDMLNGKKDIDNKIIRVVGNTNKKLSEDALRILRAVRFATTLNFKLDSKLEEGIKKYGYLVKDLSYDRKKSELDKIFASPNFDYGIKLIQELGLEVPLEINTYNLKQTTYLVGVWAQINTDKYNFNK